MKIDTEPASVGDLRRGDRIWQVTLAGPRWLTVCEVRAETCEWAGEVARVVFADAPSRRYLPGSTFTRRRSAR